MHSRFKHGYAPLKGKRRPIYVTWQSMHNRCYRKGNTHYKHYGARGIGVCARWSGASGFENFLADMGEPAPRMSIERVDVDKDYSPENCKWIPRGDQSKNRRHNWTVMLNGESMTAREATRKLGIHPSAIDRLLRRAALSKSETHSLNDLMPIFLKKWGLE
jgi:hypothetical protein